MPKTSHVRLKIHNHNSLFPHTTVKYMFHSAKYFFRDIVTYFASWRTGAKTLESMKTSHLSQAFVVLIVVSMKSTIFWDATPCSSIDVHRRFGGTPCLHLQGERVCQASGDPCIEKWIQTLLPHSPITPLRQLLLSLLIGFPLGFFIGLHQNVLFYVWLILFAYCLAYSSTLQLEPVRSSETPVNLLPN